MKPLPENFYQRISKLNQKVKQDLKIKGLIVPKKNKNGTISLGRFTIKKDSAGFYSIIDYRQEIVADQINLPQTAALVANKLALGKWLDRDLLAVDSKYGHASFDELIHRRSAKKHLRLKNFERAEVMLAKSDMARYKRDSYKRSIKADFEKLLKVR